MKKSILFIAALVMVFAAQAQRKIKGNGNVQKITRTTSDYDGIKCAGSFDYVLVAGTEGTITLEGEENLLEYIITEVKDGNLIIKTENHINLNPSSNRTVKVTIPFKDINEVSLAGSGDLWNEDVITADELDVSLAGSGDVVLKVEANAVDGKVAGSGDLTLKGKTNELEASVAGSGNFHGFDLLASHAEVAVSGSGDADVFCTDKLKARVAGSGGINYKGNPKVEDTKVAGSGRIESN